ncbi:MAG TPA: hypothetical protein VF189_03150 [Patescibacteria group bacterium]
MPKGGDNDRVRYNPDEAKTRLELYGSKAADLIDRLTAQENAAQDTGETNKHIDELVVEILEYRNAYRAHTKRNVPGLEVAIHLGYENEEVHAFSKNKITLTLPYPYLTHAAPDGQYEVTSSLENLAAVQAVKANTYTNSKMFYDNTIRSVNEKLVDERPQESAYRLMGEVKTVDAAIASTRGQDPKEQVYSRELHDIKNYVATGLVIVGTKFPGIQIEPADQNQLHVNISYGSASTNVWMEHMPLNDRARMRDALEKYGYFRKRR